MENKKQTELLNQILNELKMIRNQLQSNNASKNAQTTPWLPGYQDQGIAPQITPRTPMWYLNNDNKIFSDGQKLMAEPFKFATNTMPSSAGIPCPCGDPLCKLTY